MRLLLLPILAIILLSGCAEMELASHVAKQVPLPDAQQKSKGQYKVGNPYKIAGEWYKPQAQYNFTQTGTASWYGPNFNGKKTANGEIFNMNEMTAAHKTLQLPSIIRVTNVENGKTVILRVNDRGPYSKGRVLDVSKRAAQELGFIGQGTAKIKLEVLPHESLRVADMARKGQSTRNIELSMQHLKNQPANKAVPPPVMIASSTPAPSVKPSFQPSAIKAAPSSQGGIFLQAGAFGNQQTAQTLAEALQGYGPSNILSSDLNGRNLYRVRVGPFASEQEAQTVLAQINQSGKADAFLVSHSGR